MSLLLHTVAHGSNLHKYPTPSPPDAHQEIQTQSPDRLVAVVIPEIVKEHWWDYLLLDSARARRLRAALLRHGGPNLSVVMVPWAREQPHPERVIEEEEPGSAEPATASPQPAQ